MSLAKMMEATAFANGKDGDQLKMEQFITIIRRYEKSINRSGIYSEQKKKRLEKLVSRNLGCKSEIREEAGKYSLWMLLEGIDGRAGWYNLQGTQCKNRAGS